MRMASWLLMGTVVLILFSVWPWCMLESMMLQGCSCCVIPSVLLIAMVCKQTAALIILVLVTRPGQLYFFPPYTCKSTMNANPLVPLNLHDHIELLRAVRESIACPCFRKDLKITELSMYLPEGRRRRYKGKPILPTLVLQTDNSLPPGHAAGSIMSGISTATLLPVVKPSVLRCDTGKQQKELTWSVTTLHNQWTPWLHSGTFPNNARTFTFALL
jgi:hypothetical protein